MIQPKYSAVISVFPYSVSICFARPVDSDLLLNIQQLQEIEGFKVYQSKIESGSPWWITFNPTYDSKEVGIELEKILHRHSIDNLLIKVYDFGAIPLVVSTLLK